VDTHTPLAAFAGNMARYSYVLDMGAGAHRVVDYTMEDAHGASVFGTYSCKCGEFCLKYKQTDPSGQGQRPAELQALVKRHKEYRERKRIQVLGMLASILDADKERPMPLEVMMMVASRTPQMKHHVDVTEASRELFQELIDSIYEEVTASSGVSMLLQNDEENLIPLCVDLQKLFEVITKAVPKPYEVPEETIDKITNMVGIRCISERHIQKFMAERDELKEQVKIFASLDDQEAVNITGRLEAYEKVIQRGSKLIDVSDDQVVTYVGLRLDMIAARSAEAADVPAGGAATASAAASDNA
jgi:hypothetical protein